MLEIADTALRLGAALAVGAIVGVDRELKRKPAGIRTHALVSTGAAITLLTVIGASGADADAVSRAVQGIITGIGFLGAGVIMQYEDEKRIDGLTTAASIWAAAALGMACGAGLVALALLSLGAIVAILVIGGRLEAWLDKRGLGNQKRARGPREG